MEDDSLIQIRTAIFVLVWTLPPVLPVVPPLFLGGTRRQGGESVESPSPERHFEDCPRDMMKLCGAQGRIERAFDLFRRLISGRNGGLWGIRPR